jgi:hypothetical protein
MKLPLTLTFVILVAGSFWGWHEHQALSALNEQRRQVLSEVESYGIPTDLKTPFQPTKLSSRTKAKDAAQVKDYANRLVDFAKRMEAMQKSGEQGGPEFQKEVMEIIGGMLDLNGEQLKILVDDLRGRTDISDEMRKNMIGFSIMMLAQDHPQQAIALFTESSDLMKMDGMGKMILSQSLTRWAQDQPDEALRWIEKNKEKYPDLVNDESKNSILKGAAQKDIRLAIQLMEELKLKDGWREIVSVAETPEDQAALLTAIRNSSAENEGEEDSSRKKGMDALADKIAAGGFEKATAFMKANQLSEDEISSLVRNLNYSETKDDTGKWLDWMSTQTLDAKDSQRRAESLVRNWTESDYKSAGEWLNQSQAGPVKDAATRSYIKTVAPYDSEVAVQWADTLPADKKGKAMKDILDQLKGKDSQAAEAFAQKYHLGKEE